MDNSIIVKKARAVVWTRHKLENDLFVPLLKIIQEDSWKFEVLSLFQGRTIKYLSDIKEMTMHICITSSYKRIFKILTCA